MGNELCGDDADFGRRRERSGGRNPVEQSAPPSYAREAAIQPADAPGPPVGFGDGAAYAGFGADHQRRVFAGTDTKLAESQVCQALSGQLSGDRLVGRVGTMTRKLCESAAHSAAKTSPGELGDPRVSVVSEPGRARISVRNAGELADLPLQTRRDLGKYSRHGVMLDHVASRADHTLTPRVTVWFDTADGDAAPAAAPVESGVPDPVEVAADLRAILLMNENNTAGFSISADATSDNTHVRVVDHNPDAISQRYTESLLDRCAKEWGWSMTRPDPADADDVRSFQLHTGSESFQLPEPVTRYLPKLGKDITFRAPSPDDLDLILALERETFASPIDPLTGFEMVTLRRTYAQYCLIGEIGGKVVSYTLGGTINPFALEKVAGRPSLAGETGANWPRRGWAHASGVSPELRGNGVGVAMRRLLLQRMQANKLTEVCSTIALNNTASFTVQQNLAKEMGFGFSIEIVPNYYHEGGLKEMRAVTCIRFPDENGKVRSPIPMPGGFAIVHAPDRTVRLTQQTPDGRPWARTLDFTADD